MAPMFLSAHPSSCLSAVAQEGEGMWTRKASECPCWIDVQMHFTSVCLCNSFYFLISFSEGRDDSFNCCSRTCPHLFSPVLSRLLNVLHIWSCGTSRVGQGGCWVVGWSLPLICWSLMTAARASGGEALGG